MEMSALADGDARKERQGQQRAADHDIELALAQSEGQAEFEPRITADVGRDMATPPERQRLFQGANSGAQGGAQRQGTLSTLGTPSTGVWSRWKRFKVSILLAGVLGLAMLAVVAAMAKAVTPPDTSKVIYARFQIVGDWGRNGLHNQSDVASVMGAVAYDDRPDFVISTGDNFYESGLTSATDDQFRTSFTDVYGAPSLKGVPWHAVLGNHDYGERQPGWALSPKCPPVTPNCSYSPLHELDVGLRQLDRRWHCERAFRMSLADGKVDIFFYDTSPFIEAYQNVSWVGHLGGLHQQSWQANRAELEGRLASSQAEWKLVVGHHPVLSSGADVFHGTRQELVTHIQPLLEKYGVQAYFNGHDHHLEHLRTAGRQYPHYIISGAGSQVVPVSPNEPASIFKYYGSGFVEAVVKAEVLDLRYFGILDENHRPIYTISIPRTVPRKGGRRLLLGL